MPEIERLFVYHRGDKVVGQSLCQTGRPFQNRRNKSVPSILAVQFHFPPVLIKNKKISTGGMKEHQNVHQVINQAPTVLGLSLYRKATTPTHSPPTNRTVSLAAR